MITQLTFAIRKYFLASSMLPDALASIAAFLNWFCRFNRNVAFCSARLCVDTKNHKLYPSIKSMHHLQVNKSNVIILLVVNVFFDLTQN